MNLAGKTVVITGAAGFIGSNLAQFFLKQQAQVIGIDNLSTGRIENIADLKSLYPNRWSFIQEDIRDAQIMTQLFKTASPFITVHLAAMASVQQSMKNPLLANEINVTGFIHILQASQAVHTPYFFYASSSAVYGDQTLYPISESATTFPLSVYGATKLMNEHYARVLNPGNTKTIGMRLFNVFGPNQSTNSDYSAVIPKWMALLKDNQAVTIFGDGSATRDFCYVDNIGAFINAVLDKSHLSESTIFNVGSGKATTLNELITTIAETLKIPDVKDRCVYAPWRSSDILHSTADLCYAQEYLGFHADVDLKTGLKKCLAP